MRAVHKLCDSVASKSTQRATLTARQRNERIK
jgi:hypothetical protein